MNKVEDLTLDFYIEQGSLTKEKKEIIEKVLKENGGILVIGDSGSGKTTFEEICQNYNSKIMIGEIKSDIEFLMLMNWKAKHKEGFCCSKSASDVETGLKLLKKTDWIKDKVDLIVYINRLSCNKREIFIYESEIR